MKPVIILIAALFVFQLPAFGWISEMDINKEVINQTVIDYVQIDVYDIVVELWGKWDIHEVYMGFDDPSDPNYGYFDYFEFDPALMYEGYDGDGDGFADGYITLLHWQTFHDNDDKELLQKRLVSIVNKATHPFTFIQSGFGIKLDFNEKNSRQVEMSRNFLQNLL